MSSWFAQLLANQRTEPEFNTERQDTADLSHYDAAYTSDEDQAHLKMPSIEGTTEDLTIKVADDPLSITTTMVSREEDEGIVEDADFSSETTPAAVAEEGIVEDADLASETTLAVANQIASAADDADRPQIDSSLNNIMLGRTDAENSPAKSPVIEESFTFETCPSTDSEDSGTQRVDKVHFHDDTPARPSLQDSTRPSLLSQVKRVSSRTLTNDQVISTRNVLNVMDESGDGELDPYELQSLFISKGILVPLDVVTTVFNEIDDDGNGLLTVEEFASFLHKSKFHVRVDFCKRMWFNIDWWCIMCWLVGGFLSLIGGFYVELGITDSVNSDIYIWGAFLYLIGELRYFVPYLYNEYKGELSFERSTLKLKEELTANAAKYKSSLAEEGRGYSGNILVRQDEIDVEALRDYLKEVFANNSTSITRSHLQMVLLKVMGVVTENFRDRIFKLIDHDESGMISIDELIEFLLNWNPNVTGVQRFVSVTKEAFTDVGWIMSLVLVLGSLLDFFESINYKTKGTGLWTNDAFSSTMVIAYCFTFGTLIFAKERLQFELEKYEMEETVRVMLQEMLTRLDRHKKKGTASGEEKAFNDGVEFSKTRFIHILEEMTVYVPEFQLEVILKHIDSDGSGMISKAELESYTKVKRNKTLSVAKTCMTSLVFLSNLAWVVGSIAYVMSAYAKNDVIVDYGYKIGGITYAIGGVVLVWDDIDRRLLDQKYEDNMRDAVLKLAEQHAKGNQGKVSIRI